MTVEPQITGKLQNKAWIKGITMLWYKDTPQLTPQHMLFYYFNPNAGKYKLEKNLNMGIFSTHCIWPTSCCVHNHEFAFLLFLCRTENLIIQWASENVLIEICHVLNVYYSGIEARYRAKFKNLFSSLEFATNDHFILVSDGIDKKLRNKKLELRQNIIENSTNHKVKPCFK